MTCSGELAGVWKALELKEGGGSVHLGGVLMHLEESPDQVSITETGLQVRSS